MDMWQLQYNYFSTTIDDDPVDSSTKAGHDCLYNPLKKCSAETFAGIQDFRELMLEHIKTTAAQNGNVSFFVDACFKHGQTDRNKPFKVGAVTRLFRLNFAPSPHPNLTCRDNRFRL